MTSPEALWDKALDALRRMPGVQGVTKDYPDNGNTAKPVVDKSGTMVHEEIEASIVRAVVINDIADLDKQIAKLVADFRLDLAIEELPPIGYIRGSGANDEQVFSSPLILDGTPVRIMALTFRVRSRWIVFMDTYTRKSAKKSRKPVKAQARPGPAYPPPQPGPAKPPPP